jgi:hypothetical protein
MWHVIHFLALFDMVQHLRVTYNDIHKLIHRKTPEIASKFNPDLLIAIGGGYAFIGARSYLIVQWVFPCSGHEDIFERSYR